MVTEIKTKFGNIVMYIQDNIVSTDLEIIKNNILFLINKYQELPNIFFLNTFPIKIEEFENNLCFFEPDYYKTPINWIVGIEKTIKLIRYQLDTEKSFSLEYDRRELTVRNSLLIGNDVLMNSNEIFMTRTDSSDEMDSGWFIGNINTNLDYTNISNMKKISLYEAFCFNHKISWFINFSNNLLIFIENDKFKILKNNEIVYSIKNSFIDNLNS
ncbi:hypothetical protein O8C83_04735 [Aliarcobacter butzleri]|uniref:hypothetical protein n=1 Tax=Aliarcobacter butzleri TaxID=28197 RepID=UPI00263D3512|nr:hypothetical protein [Aliarcobacter butzleri]MDN5100117.1 hypothetical protein [Aliarcobacter butzleri]